MESNHIQTTYKIKCVSPMTFSQKMYQAKNTPLNAEEIIAQYYKNPSPEALENIKRLLDKIYDLSN